MPSVETFSRFVARVEANAHVEAVGGFYAEDSSVRENQTEPRVGRDLHIANEIASCRASSRLHRNASVRSS